MKNSIIMLICFLVVAANYISLSQEKPINHTHGIAPWTQGIKCGTYLNHSEKSKFLSGLIQPERDQFGRYILHKSYSSKDGKFLIHFDTTGWHSVSMMDSNNNSIPDYIEKTEEYLNYAFDVSINDLGYAIPMTDGQLGGSDQIDVYLWEVGNNLDGYGIYGQTEADYDPFESNPFPRYTSFIVMDNNYSSHDSSFYAGNKFPTYPTIGLEALKITAIHEFHHIIQFHYGLSFPISKSLNELTSTWIESYGYPEVKDYLIQVRAFFRNPGMFNFGSGFPDVGYKNNLFAQYLFDSYDEDVIKKMWQNILIGNKGYEALNNALISQGSDLAEAYCHYLNWIYYTGNRAKHENYSADAVLLPSINFEPNIFTYSSPSFIRSASLKSYEVMPIRIIIDQKSDFITDDTLDVLVLNTDTQSAIFQLSKLQEFTLSLSDDFIEGAIEIPELEKYLVMDGAENICYQYYVHPGNNTKAIGSPFPNPFYNPDHKVIYFPLPDSDIPIGAEAKLTVYNASMNQIYFNGNKVITNIGEQRVIEWFDIPDLNSGIYIFKVQSLGKEKLGKFAVIKK